MAAIIPATLAHNATPIHFGVTCGLTSARDDTKRAQTHTMPSIVTHIAGLMNFMGLSNFITS
jgi:hypothetical protein